MGKSRVGSGNQSHYDGADNRQGDDETALITG
jgi:hypothetical protein